MQYDVTNRIIGASTYLNRYIVLFQHRLLLIHYKIQPGRRHINEQYRPDYRQSKLTSSYYMTNITSGEMEDCEWLRSTFSGPLSSRNGPAVHYVKTNA